jgi:diadenylate cyclase
MLSELGAYFVERDLKGLAKDGLDIFLVYYLFYRSLLVVRGTRALQVGLGLGLIFVLYVFAQTARLATLQSVLGALFPQAALLLIIVVFQTDIRRALMRVGGQRWLGKSKAQESEVIDEVVEAATELARHRTGAIITFEQDANLDEFVGANKGHSIDAAVSRELLVSIFLPESMNKLHDGAVIIRNLRIAKAGVFFPMPEQRVLDASFGSRHRAALGITEETDAVVVVVSEERGSISFCFNGNIVSNLDGPGLRRALEGIFSPRAAARRTLKPAKERERGGARVSEAAEPETQTADRPTSPSEPPPMLEATPLPRTSALGTAPEEPPNEPAPPPLRKARAESTEVRPTETAPLPPAAIPLKPKADETLAPTLKKEPTRGPQATAPEPESGGSRRGEP